MTLSYIIHDGRVIATTERTNSRHVRVSSQCCVESVNFDRDYTLVNVLYAKISNAKKWDRYEYRVPHAVLLNHCHQPHGIFDEFLIVNDTEN